MRSARWPRWRARGAEPLRLDKYLWFVRLVKTRAHAAAIAEQGHLRIDGRAIDRAHAAVRIGQVLGIPVGGRVRVLRVVALPARRGPAPEARLCYEDLDAPPPAGAPAHANVSQEAGER